MRRDFNIELCIGIIIIMVIINIMTVHCTGAVGKGMELESLLSLG